ncbi:hypothetical protein V500_08798 [Pseudogymnoascus sp. VKM F-4518 (FW-2643)]|nr:hypothetical protein V500_08798 [Pseudogymnoascus sp. VKM F-4518 (FW-2643)]
MTVVFRTESGPLTQIQIGPADILATFAAAYTASGWLGGLDGIRSLLSRSSQFFSASSKAKQNQLLQRLFREDLKLQNAAFYILTSEHGPVRCEIPTSQTAFGGTLVTKIIGFTICALAHEGGYDTAVKLFTEYLAPLIFDGAAELVGALQSQLRENTTMDRLINEGATLGLPTIFLEVSQRLGLPTGDGNWLNRKLHEGDLDLRPTEWHFVIGLLRWLGSGMNTPYLTRSGLVARVAGYLQAVGYGIGSIIKWQGSPPRPRIPSPMTVVLVLGGSEETDTLMEDLFEMECFELVMHYTYNTVGAMLYQSLFQYTTTPPEVFQSDFEEIYHSIQSRLQTKYHLPAGERGASLCVACHWKPSSSTSSPIAMRLAAIHFPLLADQVAPCYERIATSTILKSAKDQEERNASAHKKGLSQGIVRFREYTAAILISLIASLSRDDFCNFKHVTRLNLGFSSDLDDGCRFADGCFSSSVKFTEAAQLLASIHAARIFEFPEPESYNIESDSYKVGAYKIVGWRHGIHCVLPNLLLDMKPSAESITLACRDVFYANVRFHEDGSIKSSSSPFMKSESIHLEDQTVLGADLSVMEISQHPWVGPAQTNPPNRLLYLGLERPLHYNDPDICFVGRVDGNVIGSVSVLDVLCGIARNFSHPQECCHDEISIDVVNIQTSTWINKKSSIPVGTVEIPALLAVKDDPSWALFVIGQSVKHQSCIVLGCVSCALYIATRYKGAHDGVVLVGYR